MVAGHMVRQPFPATLRGGLAVRQRAVPADSQWRRASAAFENPFQDSISFAISKRIARGRSRCWQWQGRGMHPQEQLPVITL
jgi:hypothetical protein